MPLLYPTLTSSTVRFRRKQFHFCLSVSLIRCVCAVHYSFLRRLGKQRAAFISYLLNADKKEGTAILAAQGPFILATHSHQSGCSVQFPIRVCSLTPGGAVTPGK